MIWKTDEFEDLKWDKKNLILVFIVVWLPSRKHNAQIDLSFLRPLSMILIIVSFVDFWSRKLRLIHKSLDLHIDLKSMQSGL